MATLSVHSGRKVLKDFVFSDGTAVPAGSTLYVNSYGVHHDENIYSDPHHFDGFRYVRVDNNEVDENASGGAKEQQLQMARPTLEYHAFGYGKHAW